MGRYLALLMVLLGAGNAAAASDAVTVAVLGLEPNDVPESLAAQLTDALRQRVAAMAGVRMIPGKDLIEVKIVFGCDAELPTCMAQAGKTIGAEKLIYGSLKKGANKGSVTVALKVLDVKGAMVEKFVNDTVQKRELASSNVAASAGKWLAQLLEEQKPTLAVSSDPSGATIAIDGQSFGKTPASLRELSPGTHTVALSLPGRKTVVRTVELRAGKESEVTASLEPEVAVRPKSKEPPKVQQPPEENPLVVRKPEETKSNPHPGRTAKIVAGGLLGGALVTGSVLIYSFVHYRSLEDDLSKMNINCTTTTSPKCDEGNNWAHTATGMWIATGALLGGSIVSFAIGSYQAKKAHDNNKLGFLQKSLRVEPVFSTRGGGLTAAFEF
jgi:hypothetical protein